MKKILGLFILLLSITFLFPTGRNALNSNAYMVITNPGENSNSQMNISWHMDLGEVNGKVVYTTKSDTLWENAVTVNGNFEKVSVFKTKEFLKYSITLRDLDSDTEYMYRVGGDNFGDTYYFKTAGAEEFSFAWVGDWHSYTAGPARTASVTNMLQKAVEVEPQIDFMLSTGDMLAYGSDYQAWSDLYNNFQYKNYMWSTAIGNHDIMNNEGGSDTEGYFQSTHNFPKNGYEGQEGSSYYFKYGNALFIVLNSEDIVVRNNIVSAQEWASNVIKTIPSDYIFVSMHYHWFNGETGSNYQYNNWKNFFDEHEVDLAMAGHNHVYSRTHKLKNDQVSDEGTVYMVNPSTDNDRGRPMNENYSNQDKIAARWTEGTYTMGAVIISVSKDKINTRLIDRNGVVQDEVDITARDKSESINKDDFLQSFTFIPLADGRGIISASPVGVGHVEKIEYINANTNSLIATNYFYNKSHSSFTISNLNGVDKLKINVVFKDKTNLNLELKIVSKDFYNLRNLNLDYDAGKYKLMWDYTGNSNETAWVFINNEAYKEVGLSTKEVVLNDVGKTDKVSIRTSENSLFDSYVIRYNTFGDINSDGLIDENDLNLSLILNNELIKPDELYFIDIDGDMEFTIIDISYIHLYINGIVKSLSNETYEITYLDYFDEVVSVETITNGKAINPPVVEISSEYRFKGWNIDLFNISTDLIARPVFEFVGDGFE